MEGFTEEAPFEQGLGGRFGFGCGQIGKERIQCRGHSMSIGAAIRQHHAKSLQSCPALCNPMDCSLPDSPVQGMLQARLLAWVAMPFSRECSISKH